MGGTTAETVSYIRNENAPSSVTIQRRTADQRASPDPVSHHQGGRYDDIAPEVPGAIAALLAAHLTQAGVGFQSVRRGPAAAEGPAVEVPDPHAGVVVRVLDEPWEPARRGELDRVQLRAADSDSTLDDVVGQFSGDEVADLRRQLHAQIHTEWRSKSLEPVGFPCGVVAVDHKTLWTGLVPQAHDPHAPVVHQPERRVYAQVGCARCCCPPRPNRPSIRWRSAPTPMRAGCCPRSFGSWKPRMRR